MFSFKYIGCDGKCTLPTNSMSALAQSKGLLSISIDIGNIKAVDFDAAKRGMCAFRKKYIRSVDALALGVDGRFYFIEFKDRNFNTLNMQGRDNTTVDYRGRKSKSNKTCNQNKIPKQSEVRQEPTIAEELCEKIFDSILLASLGEEQWRIVDFVNNFCANNSLAVSDIRKQSVFIFVYNDMNYEKDVTRGEVKFLETGKKLAGIASFGDPQISGAQIYWGLEKFAQGEYCAEVHTLTIPEFECYAANRFKSF